MNRCDETALDYILRVQVERFYSKLSIIDHSFPNGISPRECIEICGEEATVKTHLLHCITASYVLPPQYGGYGGKAYYFDLDFGFDACKFRKILRYCIQQHHDIEKDETYHLQNESNDEQTMKKTIESVLDQCMKNVHLFQCRSTMECLSTLIAIRHEIISSSMGTILVFDRINSFQFHNKMLSKLVGDGLTMEFKLFSTLKELIKNSSVVVIASNQEIYMNRTKQSLSTYWSSQVTRKLWISPTERGGEHQYEAKCNFGTQCYTKQFALTPSWIKEDSS